MVHVGVTNNVVLHSSHGILPYNSLHASYWPYIGFVCTQCVGERCVGGVKNRNVQNTLELPKEWVWVSPNTVVLHSFHGFLPNNSLHTSYWSFISLSRTQSVGERGVGALKHGNVQNTLEPLLWCMWVSPQSVVLHSSHGLLPYNSLHTSYWTYISL